MGYKFSDIFWELVINLNTGIDLEQLLEVEVFAWVGSWNGPSGLPAF